MAATIVKSAVVEDHEQLDGRRTIIEHHTDSAGVVHTRTILVSADWDARQELMEHAIRLDARLVINEVRDTDDAHRASVRAKIDAYVAKANPASDLKLSPDERTMFEEEGDSR